MSETIEVDGRQYELEKRMLPHPFDDGEDDEWLVTLSSEPDAWGDKLVYHHRFFHEPTMVEILQFAKYANEHLERHVW